MILRRFLQFAVLLALISSTCIAAFAADSDVISTTDDARLDQKVTYSADGVSVATILGQLSASTGVTMSAGVDKNDWTVQDRKVIVHVVDMKLADLMQELSSLLRFHWSKGTDAGKPTYRLWQDKQQRAEEESLRSAADDNQSKQAREKRENAIADMVNLGSLSSTDAAKLKTTDPWRYILATEPLGRDVADFLNNDPDARNAFIQGTDVSFPVLQLTPQLQNTVQRIAESYDALSKSIGVKTDHAALLSKFEKLQITINRHALGSGDIVSKSMLGQITISSGVDSLDIPLFDPSSPVGRALAKAIVNLKSGVSTSEVQSQLQSEMTSAVQAAEAAQPAGRDISSDPALRVKVKLFDTSTSAPLPVALKAIAQKTKLNIISDYFPSAAQTMDGTEKTLGEQLEAIRLAYGSNWTKAGNVLRFQDKEWFKKRAWAVPDVWMKYWSDRGTLNNGLLIDDLAQIGNLRDEQIDHTIMTDSKLVRMGAGEAARNREILRFYGALKPNQIDEMTKSHLPVASLTDDQWTALQAALAVKNAAYSAVQKQSQFIQLTISGKDAVDYKFAYYAGENDPPVVFNLSSDVVYKTKDEVAFPEKHKQ